MQTFRDIFTSEEEVRLRDLYARGHINRYNVGTFLERFQRELNSIDSGRAMLDDPSKIRDPSGVAANQIEMMEMMGHDYEVYKKYQHEELDKRRAKAFDTALSSNVYTRTRQDVQDLTRAVSHIQPEGDTLAERAWQKFWRDDEGNITAGSVTGGVWDIGKSLVTSPIAAVDRVSRGDWEHPLENIAGLGAFIPIGRGAANLVSASLHASAKGALWKVLRKAAKELPENATPAQVKPYTDALETVIKSVKGRKKVAEFLSTATRHPLWRVPSGIVETADIVGAREEVYIELAAEGIFEGVTRTLGHIGGRPLDTDITHDQLTGSKTEPQPDPRVPSDADAGVQPDPVTPGGVPDPREGAAALDAQASALEEVALAAAEGKEVSEDTRALAFAAYEAEYVPFFQRRAQDKPELAARLLQESWDAGVLDPIAALYDEIYAKVADTGLPPSKAHIEAEEQLRGELGPDLYKRYRGAEYGVIPDLSEFDDFYMDIADGNDAKAQELRQRDEEAGVQNPIDDLYDKLHAKYEGESPSEARAFAERDLRRELGEKLYDKYRTRQSKPTVADSVRKGEALADSVVSPIEGEKTDDTETETEAETTTAPIGTTSTDERTPSTSTSKTPETAADDTVSDDGTQESGQYVEEISDRLFGMMEQGELEYASVEPALAQFLGEEVDAGNITGDQAEGLFDPILERLHEKLKEQETVDQEETPDETDVDKMDGEEVETDTDISDETSEEQVDAEEEPQVVEEDQRQDGTGDVIQPLQDTPDMRVAAWAANKFANSEKITTEELVAKADEEFGGTFGEGAYNLVDMYDLLEVAGNQFLASLSNVQTTEMAFRMLHRSVQSMEHTINKLIEELESLMPTPKRDVEKIEAQQFSTPFHYAYLIQWLANFSENDVMLEPSAGTGNLAWLPKLAGIEVFVNEIAARRLNILEAMGFENITSVDARQLSDLMAVENPALQPSVILMNPPFSSNTATGASSSMVGANMVSEALKTLVPGGRLVAIVSGGSPAFENSKGMAFNGSKEMRAWWKPIRKNYIVRANVHVSGDVYKKFGTTFDTRVLVIDKPLAGQAVPSVKAIGGSVDTVAALPKKLEKIRDERITDPDRQEQQPDQQESEEPIDDGAGDDTTRAADSEPGGEGDTPDDSGKRGEGDTRDDTDRDGGDLPGESDEGGGTSRADTDGLGDDDQSATRSDTESESDDAVMADRTGDQPSEESTSEDSDERVDDGSDGRDDTGGAGDGDRRDSTQWSDTSDSDTGGQPDTDTRESARDESTQLDEEAIDKIVDAIYESIGEEHVEGTPLVTPTSLAITSSPDVSDIPLEGVNLDELSEAQAVMAKRIIRSWVYFKGGDTDFATQIREGFYVGDGAGTGKTRIGAAVILDAIAQGHTKHVVVTENNDLFKKFNKDYSPLGGDTSKVFKHSTTKSGDKIKAKEGVMITPYTTLGKKTGKGIESQWSRLSQALEWIVGAKPPVSLLGGAEFGQDMTNFDVPDLPGTLQEAYSMRSRDANHPFRTFRPLESLLKAFEKAIESNNYHAQTRLQAQYEKFKRQMDEQYKYKADEISPQEWMQKAREFEGVIVMDESHNMVNTRGDKPANKAIAGLIMQRLLPRARIVYMSATGTVSLADAAYLERIGLFGIGTPFRTFEDMYGTLGNKTALEELAATSLKERGHFDARLLSYEGVEYDEIVHAMTPDQVEAYNRLSDIWRTVEMHFNNWIAQYAEIAKEADAGSDLGSRKGQFLGKFWGANQRFWINYMMSVKTQTVLPEAIKTLEGGEKVLFRILNTNQASQDRAVAAETDAGKDIEDFQINIAETLVNFIEGSFPTEVLTVSEDANGEPVMTPLTKVDDQGRRIVVQDQDMLEIKEELLRTINDLDVPAPAMDLIVQGLRDAGYDTAEISGRTERYVWIDDGKGGKKRVLEKGLQGKQEADLEKFLDGSLKAIVYTKKGEIGRDMHSMEGQPRHHLYVIQTGWNVASIEQAQGRPHRAGQSQAPFIHQTRTDLPAESRVTATAASRLKSMGATTRGSAEATGGRSLLGDGGEEYLTGKYGKMALYLILKRLHINQGNEDGFIPVPEMIDEDNNPLQLGFRDLLNYLGLRVDTDKDGGFQVEDVPKVERFLNRLMNSRVAIQRAVSQVFLNELDDVLKQAEEAGTLDQGAEVVRTSKAVLANETLLDTDEQSGAKTNLVEIDTEKQVRKTNKSDIANMITYSPTSGTGVFRGFMTIPIHSPQYPTGKLVAAFRASSNTISNTGIPVPRLRLVGADSKIHYVNESQKSAMYTNSKRHGIEFTDDLQQIWDEQTDAVPDTTNEKIYVATGQLIQNWKRLSIGEADESSMTQADLLASVQIKRVVLDNGRQVLGRIIPERFVPSVLKEFGVSEGAVGTTPDTTSTQPERAKHTLQSLTGAILSGEEVHLENGWSLKAAVRASTNVILLRRNGQNNPNITSTEMSELGLKSISGAGGLEWYVPSAETAVLSKLLERYKPRDIDLETETTPDDIPDDDEGGGTPQSPQSQAPESDYVEDILDRLLGILGDELLEDMQKQGWEFKGDDHVPVLWRMLNEEVQAGNITESESNEMYPSILERVNEKVRKKALEASDASVSQLVSERLASKETIRLKKEEVADLTEMVEQIIGRINDVEVKKRVLGLYGKIIDGEHVNIVGHQATSAEEIAVLGQAMRHILMEVSRRIYMIGNVVVGHDGTDLNATNRTSMDPRKVDEHIRQLEKKHGKRIDGIWTLHNHPNAQPVFSDADKKSTNDLKEIYGKRYKGEVIINSGRYAHAKIDSHGNITYHNQVMLPADLVGFDTTATPLDSGVIPGDPLYEGMRPEAIEEFQRLYPSLDAIEAVKESPGNLEVTSERYKELLVESREKGRKAVADRTVHEAIAGLGKYFKTQKGWTVFVGVSSVGHVISAFELTGVAELAQHGKELYRVTQAVAEAMGAHKVHVISPDTEMKPLFESAFIGGLPDGIASVWAGGETIGEVVTEPFAEIFPISTTRPKLTQHPLVDEPLGTEQTDTSPVGLSDKQIGEHFATLGVTDIGFQTENFKSSDSNTKLRILEGIYDTLILQSDDNSLTSEQVTAYNALLKHVAGPDWSEQNLYTLDDVEDGIIMNEINKFQASIKEADSSAVLRVVPDGLMSSGKRQTKLTKGARTVFSTILNPQTDLYHKMNALTPELRKAGRLVAKMVRSGYAKLREMEAPIDATGRQTMADYIREVVDHVELVKKSGIIKDVNRIGPVLDELNKLSKTRAAMREPIAGRLGIGKSVGQIRGALDRKVYRFIELNWAIEGDPKLLEIAKELKEVVREFNFEKVELMAKLRYNLGKLGEELVVYDDKGRPSPWLPEGFDGFEPIYNEKDGTITWKKTKEWDPTLNKEADTGITWGGFKPIAEADQKTYSNRKAHNMAERLYTPHHYAKDYVTAAERNATKLMKVLNVAEKDNDASKAKFAGIEKNDKTGKWEFTKTGEAFDTDAEVIKRAKRYWSREATSMKTYLNEYDKGLLGMYGHLERKRQSQDRSYSTSTDFLLSNAALFWSRYGEISVYGQRDPLTGQGPRLKAYLNEIRAFRKNERELAFGALMDALGSGQPGMFQMLPLAGEGGETLWDVATKLRQPKPVHPALAEDAEQQSFLDAVHAGINELDAEHQTELQRIGMIEPDSDSDSDGYKLVGKDFLAQQATFMNFTHEFYNTIQQRVNSVENLVLGLGYWQKGKSLDDKDIEQVYKAINTAVTISTLGPRTALQNITEIPLVGMVSGPKASWKTARNFARDPDSKRLYGKLVGSISAGTEYLADNTLQKKYLGSPFSLFTYTDKMSRMIGGALAWEESMMSIEDFLSDPSKKNRKKLEAIGINPVMIEAYRIDDDVNKPDLDAIFAEAKERKLADTLMTGDVIVPGAPEASHKWVELIGNEMGRSALYVSESVFKPYDARTLPDFLVNASPLWRIFTKYLAWVAQMNQYMVENYIKAFRDAKEGDWTHFGRIGASSVALGMPTAFFGWMFAAMQGYHDDEDDTVVKYMLEGVLSTQTLGIAAFLGEKYLFSGGNRLILERDLTRAVAGPGPSIFIKYMVAIVERDWEDVKKQTARRIPITREASQLGLLFRNKKGLLFWDKKDE